MEEETQETKAPNGNLTAVIPKLWADDNIPMQILGWTGRTIMGALSIFTFFLGVMFCITIIGIPVGLYLFYSGKLSMGVALGERKAPCPNCTRKSTVRVGQMAFKCKHCDEKINVQWGA